MNHCARAVPSTNHCTDYSCYTLSQAYKMGPRCCFCCRNSQTDAKRIGPAEHFQIMTGQAYSKVSIKRPVQKKINRTVLFQGCHGQFLVSIKQPRQDIWKKSLTLDNQSW